MSRPQPRMLTTDTRPVRQGLARWLVNRMFRKHAGAAPGVLPARGIHRILVCKISHTLGNTLLMTPLLQEMERRYPGAEVDVVTRSPVAPELFRNYRNVRSVYRWPAHALRHPRQVVRLLRGMRRARYDLAIDADPRSQSGRLLVNLAAAAHSVGFVGSEKAGRVSLPVEIPSGPRRQSALPVQLVRLAAGEGPGENLPAPDLRVDARERELGRDQLATVTRTIPAIRTGALPADAPVIGIFANATGHKLIAGDWWRQFLAELERQCPAHVFLEIVPATGRSMLGDCLPGFYSTDIRKLATVLSALSVYVSADCGIMHLANASAPRTIGLFDGTDPDEWGTRGPGSANVRINGREPEAVAREVAGLVASLPPAPGRA